jgi:lipopolysaccharide heptosyltransferase II
MRPIMTDSHTREFDGNESVIRVLVIAPNWLGDVVMAAPLLTFLHDTFSSIDGYSCELVLGVRRRWAPLFEADPRVSEILTLERTGIHRGVTGLWRQAGAMRQVGADAVVLGPPSLRAALAARLAGIPLRAGSATDGRGWLLNCATASPLRGSVHYTEEMIQLGAALLRCSLADWPAAPLSEARLASAKFESEQYLPGCAAWPEAAVGEGPPLWALAPGTTFGQAKTWPAPRVVEFLQSAVRDRERRLVLLGDGSSAEFCAQLRRDSGLPWREVLEGPAGVVDLTGKTDLRGVVRLLKASSCFVGNDSGLMHLAGVLGLPTVGIFGSSNPDWTAPAGPRTAVVVADGFPCRPCYRPTCNQPKFCLEDVPASRALGTLDSLLEGASDRPLPGGGN